MFWHDILYVLATLARNFMFASKILHTKNKISGISGETPSKV